MRKHTASQKCCYSPASCRRSARHTPSSSKLMAPSKLLRTATLLLLLTERVAPRFSALESHSANAAEEGSSSMYPRLGVRCRVHTSPSRLQCSAPQKWRSNLDPLFVADAAARSELPTPAAKDRRCCVTADESTYPRHPGPHHAFPKYEHASQNMSTLPKT